MFNVHTMIEYYFKVKHEAELQIMEEKLDGVRPGYAYWTATRRVPVMRIFD